jgi:hypothetical protein
MNPGIGPMDIILICLRNIIYKIYKKMTTLLEKLELAKQRLKDDKHIDKEIERSCESIKYKGSVKGKAFKVKRKLVPPELAELRGTKLSPEMKNNIILAWSSTKPNFNPNFCVSIQGKKFSPRMAEVVENIWTKWKVEEWYMQE